MTTIEGIKADIQKVIDRWETGDLAGAVRGLPSTIASVEDLGTDLISLRALVGIYREALNDIQRDIDSLGLPEAMSIIESNIPTLTPDEELFIKGKL